MSLLFVWCDQLGSYETWGTATLQVKLFRQRVALTLCRCLVLSCLYGTQMHHWKCVIGYTFSHRLAHHLVNPEEAIGKQDQKPQIYV